MRINAILRPSLLVLALFVIAPGLNAIKGYAGSKRPDAKQFTLGTLEGDKEISLEDYIGKAVVINFWATWCGPCREEMPLFQEEWERHKDDNVVFIGINVMDDKTLASALVKEMGITYTNVHDSNGKVSNKYGVIALPATFFINKEGKVVVKNYGPFLGEEGEKKFRSNIEEISQ